MSNLEIPQGWKKDEKPCGIRKKYFSNKNMWKEGKYIFSKIQPNLKNTMRIFKLIKYFTHA